MEFTSENFESEVLKSDMPVLVDFYADWCAPCKRMAPVVEALAAEFDGKIKIGKLDVDQNADLAVQYQVMSIPMLIIFKNGEIVQKELGIQTKKFLTEALNQVLQQAL